ncbi:MAG: YDG domain-containing protein [Bacteroidota bacterium]
MKSTLLKKIGAVRLSFLLFSFFVTINITSQVTVTSATGGINLSADKAANATTPAYTTLGDITIRESNKADIAGFSNSKTFTITPPTGWSFNAGIGSVSAPFSPTGDITAISINVTISSIIVTYSTNNDNRTDTITISGIQVRATDGANLPGSGNMLFSALTSPISGIAAGTTTAGSLSQVVGAMKYLVVTLPGQTFNDGSTLAGSGNTGTVTAQIVGTSFSITKLRATDQFYNLVTAYSGSKTIAYAGPGNSSGGSATYTTAVTFASGVSTTTLTTSLRKAETTTITATEAAQFSRASSNLTVAPKLITISAPSVISKIYDGTTAATITGTLSGILNGDAVTLNGTGIYNNKNVGVGKSVTGTCTTSGTDAANYTITQPNGLTGAITIKGLTVTADNASKYFNATYTLGTTAFSSNGLANGDSITGVTLTSTGATSTAAVGTYAIVPSAASGVMFNANNYAITYINGTLTVNAASVGGTVTGDDSICVGTGASLSLSGQIGSVIRWEYAMSPFTSWIPIANTTTAYTSSALTQTTRFRAIVQYGSSAPANATAAEVTIGGTTSWNGTAWSNGTPNSLKAVVLSGNYTSNGNDIMACSLTVNNNATVIFSSGDAVDLSGPITVETGSSVTFESNANLIQHGTTNNNSGNVIIKRESALLQRLDYTLWSSPVSGQQLQPFSPQTLSNRFYTYGTATNSYDVIAAPSTTIFDNAKGYLIRVANNHPTTPQSWIGSFRGVPNNGNYTFALQNSGAGNRFNLIGNPYPSPLDMDAFINNANNAVTITGTLYFFRKTNGTNMASYCTLTPLGGFVSNGNAAANAFAQNPTSIIEPGQGFFVEATGNGSGTVQFDNTMRSNSHNNHFLRTGNAVTAVEKHRIWLNAINAAGYFSQTMVGYITDATQDVDTYIDGKYINDGDVALTSLIGTTPYAIQGRALPFDAADVVPLSFKATTAGDYTIAIDHTDGLFSNGQAIYLRDNLSATVHDLTFGGYAFASDAGTFTSRFELVYQQQLLGVSNPTLSASQVVIYRDTTNNLVVNSGNQIMSKIKVFDITGKLLLDKNNINASQTAMNIPLANEVVLVQITTDTGVVVTKKYMLQRMSVKKDKEIMVKVQLAEDE